MISTPNSALTERRATPTRSAEINGHVSTDPEKQRLRLIRAVSLFFAAATSVGTGLRLFVAPMSATVLAVDCICVFGFLLANALAQRGKRKAAGNVTMFFMALLILVTGFFAGALDAPVILVSPLIPLTACLLIGASAGMLWAIVVSAILITFAAAGAAGWPLPTSPLDANGLHVMRVVMLTLTSLLATAAVWHYERIQAELRSLALKDLLTGIANRGSLDIQLQHEYQRACRSKEPLSLLIFDVDQFKAFNDHYGHQAGDVCLQKIASSVAQRMRRASDFFARYGGEEFVVLLPNTKLAEATRLAETFRERIIELNIEHELSSYNVVTISIGVASMQGSPNSSASELISAADIALYQAKDNGRNKVNVYQPNGEKPTAAVSDNISSLSQAAT